MGRAARARRREAWAGGRVDWLIARERASGPACPPLPAAVSPPLILPSTARPAPPACPAAGHLYHIRWGQDADTGELRLRDYWRDPVSAAALQAGDGGSEVGEGSDGEEGGSDDGDESTENA